jgi:hypothetical protein
MILNRRELYLAIATVSVLAVLLLDRVVFTPFLERGAYGKSERQRLTTEFEHATNLISKKNELARTWNRMLDGGLTDSAAETESVTLHAIRDWADETGLALSLVKPDRPAVEEDLSEIKFRAVGTGTMDSVARLLWRVETTELPVRIKKVELGSRSEGQDDLSISLQLSALYVGSADVASELAEASPGGEAAL